MPHIICQRLYIYTHTYRPSHSRAWNAGVASHTWALAASDFGLALKACGASSADIEVIVDQGALEGARFTHGISRDI